MKDKWSKANPAKGAAAPPFFTPDEFDIYVKKATKESFIFHGKPIDYDSIDHLEYDPKKFRIAVVHTSGLRQDLGVKIQWLVRAHLQDSREIRIVRTENGESKEGRTYPLKTKEKVKK